MPKIILLFPIWLMGVIIPFVPKLNILTNKTFSFVVKAGFSPLILLANYFADYIIADFILGLYITLFLLILRFSEKRFKEFKVVNLLSNMSFSLYAIHYPLLVFIISGLNHVRINTVSFVHMLLFILLNLLLIGCSYLFYALTEKHTSKVSRFLINKYN